MAMSISSRRGRRNLLHNGGYFIFKRAGDVIKVHSCSVESVNHKQPVEIIDEFGCPRDGAIPEIEYQNDLTAGLRVGAFSLEFGEVSFYFLNGVIF
jgi:hypothetical protein